MVLITGPQARLSTQSPPSPASHCGEGGAEDGEGRRGPCAPSLGSPAGVGKEALMVAMVSRQRVWLRHDGHLPLPLLTAVRRPPGALGCPGDLRSSKPRPWLPPEGTGPAGRGSCRSHGRQLPETEGAPLLLRSCWKLHQTLFPRQSPASPLLRNLPWLPTAPVRSMHATQGRRCRAQGCRGGLQGTGYWRLQGSAGHRAAGHQASGVLGSGHRLQEAANSSPSALQKEADKDPTPQGLLGD